MTTMTQLYTIPTNKFSLTSNRITGITFDAGSLDVAQGARHGSAVEVSQPSSQSPSTWTLELAAERSLSSAVADNYLTDVGGAFHTFSGNKTTKVSSPTKLHFAFSVSVNFALPDGLFTQTLVLGQGHRSSANNWWVGGVGVARDVATDLGFLVVSNRTASEVVGLFQLLQTTEQYSYALV